MASHAVPRLRADLSHVCTKKILVASKATGIDLAVESCSGTVPELSLGHSVIRYTNGILRYLGRVIDGNDMYGRTFIESAQVDAWLDWADLEIAARPSQAIEALERHLCDKVFLVGQRYTLADISASVALHQVLQQDTSL